MAPADSKRPSRRRFLQAGSACAATTIHCIRSDRLASSAETNLLTPSLKADGYKGIWFELGQKSEYGDKYSGGLGTYTANHVPMAIYSREENKTFFVYGGAKDGKRSLMAMASYYDHDRGVVPRPTIVHDKVGVDDPHDNPSMAIDGDGHIWVFVSGRGRKRPGYVYRSHQPHTVASFERIAEREFTYPQPWWIDGRGFLFLFTKYTNGRELYYSTSPDGRTWSPDRKFAGIGGHYQTSQLRNERLITAFNRHPGGDVDRRTDLYFLYTDDWGASWKNVRGEPVMIPLESESNAARVRDYASDKRLVYIQDLDLDASNRPVILYTTSNGHQPGPSGDPRWLSVARWTGTKWEFTEVTQSNHNYSTGSIYHNENALWKIIAPTERGPQPIGSGGEIAVWESNDSGRKWMRARRVTTASRVNHNYVRRPINAHPDFAAFWADGDPDEFSESRLYFCNSDGAQVRQLPYSMENDFAEPRIL